MEKENKLVKWNRSENFQNNGERYNNNNTEKERIWSGLAILWLKTTTEEDRKKAKTRAGKTTKPWMYRQKKQAEVLTPRKVILVTRTHARTHTCA